MISRSRLIWLAGGLALAVSAAVAGSATIAVLDGGGATQNYQVTTTAGGVFLGNMVLCDQAAGANCATVASNALSVAAAQTGTWNIGTVTTLTGITNALPAGANIIGALSANQSVNVAQINGITPLMGNGTTGTGSPRVTIATDNGAVSGVGAGATGAAVPANAVYLGAQGSAILKGVVTCDTHAFYDASDNGKKTVVAGVSAKKIYVCGFLMATGGTATNLTLTSGTGADCVTTSVAITPAYQLLANDKVGANSTFWNGLITLANADNLCVNASAANAHQVEVWYTIQ